MNGAEHANRATPSEPFDPRSVQTTEEAGAVGLLVKVIDGCGLNDRYWVFVAGTTNVEWTLDVRDVRTDQVKTNTNPLGVHSTATTDTEAFATCP